MSHFKVTLANGPMAGIIRYPALPPTLVIPEKKAVVRYVTLVIYHEYTRVGKTKCYIHSEECNCRKDEYGKEEILASKEGGS